MIQHFTVSALIFHEGRILLIKHKKLGLWLYPGGHLEANEDPEAALYREIREEVGLSVKVLGEIDKRFASENVRVLPLPFVILKEKIVDKSEGEHWHIDMIYLCRSQSSSIERNMEETDAVGWFTLREVERLNTPPELPELIKKALETFEV